MKMKLLTDFLGFTVKGLVDIPDEVVITCVEEADTVWLTIKVAPSNVGQVIGKAGRIANALRTLAIAIARTNKDLRLIRIDIDAKPLEVLQAIDQAA